MQRLESDSVKAKLNVDVRVHFDKEPVPFSGDWMMVATVSVEGKFYDYFILKDGKWVQDGREPGARVQPDAQEVLNIVETMWSRHLSNVMMGDER